MEEHEDLEARLRAMADHPVDPAVASQHLTQMAVVRPPARLARKLQIAAAFLAGLLLGGSGLAAAGALPDQAQHVAHTTLDKVGIDVPDPERYHGPECGAEVKRNHGGYVRDDKDLAKSRCGKPVHAGQEDDGDEADDAGSKDKGEKGPCQGPPPWAGKGGEDMTPEEKAAAQAARAQACGEDDDGDETDGDAEVEERAGDLDAEEPDEDATTTTTEAPTTTTETTTTTTTTLAPNEQDPPTGA